jgi:hypothetical protein
MYYCLEDHLKLVVCNSLPRELAEQIFDMVERDVQLDTRVKKNAMLEELMKHEKFIYAKLNQELFDKYAKNQDFLYHLSNTMPSSPDDVSWYYVQSIAFDISVYYLEENNQDRWHYYLRIVLGSRGKHERIKAMQIILQT